MPQSKRSYTQEEVNEILKRALHQRRLDDQTLGHDDLVQMATEIGIDARALDAAERELEGERARDLVTRAHAKELAAERWRQASRWLGSVAILFIASGLLAYLDRPFGLERWYVWVLVVWAAVVALRIRHVFFPEASLERRKRRDERRRARQARREAWRARRDEIMGRVRGDLPYAGPDPAALERGTREFEAAVQAGVAALLSVAARKIQEHAQRKR